MYTCLATMIWMSTIAYCLRFRALVIRKNRRKEARRQAHGMLKG